MALCMVWSLVTPLMASYDEPAHMYAAAAIVRGQVNGPLVRLEPLGELHEVDVPPGLASLQHVADCLVGNPNLPATCATTTDSGGHTQYARYPQLYYAAVGLPTLLVDGRAGLRAARAVSAVVAGLFLGLGLWVLRQFHTGPGARLAAAVALTPTVTSIGGVVNSGALEVSAAFATWCGLMAMASRRDLPPPLVWITGVSLAVFVLSRPISPLWAGLTVVVALCVAGPVAVRRWAADRTVRRAAALVALAIVLAATWVFAVGRPPLLRVPGQPIDGNALEAVLGKLSSRSLSLIGDFFGLRTPGWIAAIYMVGLVVLIVSAVRHRARLVLIATGLAFAVLVASVVIEMSEYPKIGLWWQSRYSIPPLLGVPLLLAGAGRTEARWARLAVPEAAAAAHACALAWVLHRYANGVHGSWWIGDYAWNPPLGRIGIVVAVLLALGAFAAALGGRWAGGATPPAPDASRLGDGRHAAAPVK